MLRYFWHTSFIVVSSKTFFDQNCLSVITASHVVAAVCFSETNK